MEVAKERAIRILSGRKVKPNDAVMFDIDDTLITTTDVPINPMITLLNISSMMGYKVVIITARPYSLENHSLTMSQLHNLSVWPTEIHYAMPMEKGRVKLQTGYNYILSVGDMWTDLSETIWWIKLPDGRDRRVLSNISSDFRRLCT
mgnify:CR=1 FL=1